MFTAGRPTRTTATKALVVVRHRVHSGLAARVARHAPNALSTDANSNDRASVGACSCVSEQGGR